MEEWSHRNNMQVHMIQKESLYILGHCEGGMHWSLCSTVPSGQKQPAEQAAKQRSGTRKLLQVRGQLDPHV